MSREEERTQRPRNPVVFDLTSEECIWSRAGVVPSRLCINAFDCVSCTYDKVVQRRLAANKLKNRKGETTSTWRDAGRFQRGVFRDRQCRHMLSGEVAAKFCANNFDCAQCPYDQMLDDLPLSEAEEPLDSLSVAGFSVVPRQYYHRGHTWARVEYGGRVRIGLDDFASRLLGPLDEIAVPSLGAAVDTEEGRISLRRGPHRAGARFPVQGIVVAHNPRVLNSPASAKEHPFNGGWLAVIEPTRLMSDLRDLRFGDEALTWTEEEAARLHAVLAPETEFRLAATGGQAVDDIFGSLPEGEPGWDTLVREFLHT